jgi:hypothetical protein
MYLPVILLRDYGWAGFVAFAVPNVIGCAAFGYVVASRRRSVEMVHRFAGLMRWFAAITIAYHLFFIGWKMSPAIDAGPAQTMALGAARAGAVGLAGWVVGLLMGVIPTRLAWVAYGLSLVAFWQIGAGNLFTLPLDGPRGTAELMWMLPTIWFGFLLCPYLDPTFHRALQQSPSRHAFALFGVAFLVMILMTCAYAALAADRLEGWLQAHVVTQTVFTIAAHSHAMRRLRPKPSPWTLRAMALTWGFSISLGAWAGVAGLGEAIYLRYLVFYGLVFPLLLLWGLSRGDRPRWIWAAIPIALCLPLYEAGFIQRTTWLLPMALGILGISLAILPGRRRSPTSDAVKDPLPGANLLDHPSQ